MKKEYIKPTAEIVEFQTEDDVLNIDLTDPSFGEGLEDW